MLSSRIRLSWGRLATTVADARPRVYSVLLTLTNKSNYAPGADMVTEDQIELKVTQTTYKIEGI